MKSRFASRKDKNQPAIEQALTAAGYRWWSTHRCGYGYPDLHVLSKTDVPVLMECKMPGEGLTELEQDFHDAYDGPLEIVHSGEEALTEMAWWDEYVIEAR